MTISHGSQSIGYKDIDLSLNEQKNNDGGTSSITACVLNVDNMYKEDVNLRHAKVLPLFLELFKANYQSGYSVKKLVRLHQLPSINTTNDFQNRLYTLGLLYEYYTSGEKGEQETYLYTGNRWDSNAEYINYFYKSSGYNQEWWEKEVTNIMKGYVLYKDDEQSAAKRTMPSLIERWKQSDISIGWDEALGKEKKRRSKKY